MNHLQKQSRRFLDSLEKIHGPQGWWPRLVVERESWSVEHHPGPKTRWLSKSVPDQAFDFAFVHDLFEHLSLKGMEIAIAELCRVTRAGMCVGFFNMHEGSEHIVRPMDNYHWNLLSLARTKALFEQAGFLVQTVHIGTFLKWRVACDQTHNKNAYTFLVRRAGT